MDDKTRLIYQAALDRYLSAKFLQKIFRGLLTTQYIYPTALRRRTFPLLSIWNLVANSRSGTPHVFAFRKPGRIRLCNQPNQLRRERSS